MTQPPKRCFAVVYFINTSRVVHSFTVVTGHFPLKGYSLPIVSWLDASEFETPRTPKLLHTAPSFYKAIWEYLENTTIAADLDPELLSMVSSVRMIDGCLNYGGFRKSSLA